MRSQWGGSVKVFLAFTPLIAVPLIAIFGLPKLPNLAASQENDPRDRLAELEDGVGESLGFPSGKRLPTDLFVPVNAAARDSDPDPWNETNPGDAFFTKPQPKRDDPFDGVRKRDTIEDGKRELDRSTPGIEASSNEPRTFREAIAKLQSLGIRRYQLITGEAAGSFHFSCLYTPDEGSRVTRRFEDEATDQLEAVRKVLRQIEEWKSRTASAGYRGGR